MKKPKKMRQMNLNTLKTWILQIVNKYILFFIILFISKWFLFQSYNELSLSKWQLVTYGGFLLLFSSFSFLIKKYRIFYLYLLDIFLSIVFFANTLYINYFGTPITVYTFLQVKNLNGLGESIFSVFKIEYMLFIVDLFLLPFLFKLKSFRNENSKRFFSVFLVYLITGCLFISLVPFKRYVTTGNNPFKQYTGTAYLESYGILGHHFLDFYSYVKSSKHLTESEVDKIDTWFQMKNNVDEGDAAKNPLYGFGEGKNLILIQVESLQNFVINREYGGQEITPNLNRMLKNSIYFPNIYAQTIEGNSSDAEFLTQTSLYPISKGSVFFRYPNNKYISIGQSLKDKGYSTLAIHADEAAYWNRDIAYPGLGFDEFLSIEDLIVDEEIGMGLSDRSMYHQTIDQLKEMKNPFYSFYITLTNHMPFDLPKAYRDLKLPSELDTSLLGGYLQSVNYTDKAIGDFIEELKESGLLDESIIVLYGDHDGIFEKDREMVANLLEKEQISHKQWIREFAPIPLIIYNPALEGQMKNMVGGQIDVFPTLAGIMGIEPEKISYTMGNDLLVQNENSVIIPQGAYSKKPSYYITNDEIDLEFTEEENLTIEVSNLIIRGNYFKK